MRDLTLLVQGDVVRCSVTREGDAFVVRAHGGEHRFGLAPVAPGILLLTAAGRSRIVHAAEGEGRRWVHVDGVTVEYATGPAEDLPREVSHRRGGDPVAADLTAPMPGVVTHVLVHEGEAVKRGQPLVIVEAMKMEHMVRATHAGTVRAVRVREGEQVDGGAVVVEIGPPRSGGPPRVVRRG